MARQQININYVRPSRAHKTSAVCSAFVTFSLHADRKAKGDKTNIFPPRRRCVAPLLRPRWTALRQRRRRACSAAETSSEFRWTRPAHTQLPSTAGRSSSSRCNTVHACTNVLYATENAGKTKVVLLFCALRSKLVLRVAVMDALFATIDHTP